MEVKYGLSLCIPLRSDGFQTDAERVFSSSGGGGPSGLRVSFMRSRTSQCGCLK